MNDFASPLNVSVAAVEGECQRILAAAKSPYGVEADVVRIFVESSSVRIIETRIPMSLDDTIIREMAFKFGRADIVVFHIDGSASVIEAKDGAKGYNHVVAGIGQAGLYSAQLAMNKGALTVVRKCLLWTSTGNVALDSLIEAACEQSGTVALPWAHIKTHTATEQAVRNLSQDGRKAQD